MSDLSVLATDNQRANAPRFFVLSLFFLCFGSGFSLVIRAQNATFLRHSFSAFSLLLPRVSISSLFRLSRLFLVFRARKVKFCEVLKTDLFFSFSGVKSQVLTGFQILRFS